MRNVRTYADPLDPDKDISVSDPLISAAAYAEVVQKMPIPCTDVIVVADGGLYLAKRSVYPMKGTWRFGGRIFFNDATLEDSAARCLARETGYRIDPARLTCINTQYVSWVNAAQGDHGSKNLVVNYALHADKHEIETMACGLVETEYDRSFGLQFFDRKRLIDEDVHPSLIEIYDDLF